MKEVNERKEMKRLFIGAFAVWFLCLIALFWLFIVQQ